MPMCNSEPYTQIATLQRILSVIHEYSRARLQLLCSRRLFFYVLHLCFSFLDPLYICLVKVNNVCFNLRKAEHC